MSIFSRQDSELGLTQQGVRNAVVSYCDPPGHRDGGIKFARQCLRPMYYHLITRGEATREGLLTHYSPGRTLAHSQGLYVGGEAVEWWEDIGRTEFQKLPGVSSPPESEYGDRHATWSFSGVNPNAFDEQHLISLPDLRSQPRVQASIELDDMSVPQGSDEQTAILDVVERIGASRSLTSADLTKVVSRSGVELEAIEGTLTDLSVLEREEEHPPSPEEIPVDTYADVLQAERLVDQDTTVRWYPNSSEA